MKKTTQSFSNFGITFEHPYWIVYRTPVALKSINSLKFKTEVFRDKNRSVAVAVAKNERWKQKSARVKSYGVTK